MPPRDDSLLGLIALPRAASRQGLQTVVGQTLEEGDPAQSKS
ncbi:MAG: hypothetical protein ABIP08_07445 [Lautropia sp.]